MKLFSKKSVRSPWVVHLVAEVVYRAAPDDWQITQKESSGTILFSWFDVGQSVNIQLADASALRDAFFSVKTPEQAVEFLRLSGPFRADSFSVTWAAFLAWQAYFTRQRTLPKGWGSLPEKCSESSRLRIIGEPSLRTWAVPRRNGKEQVTLLLECDSVVEAVAAVNYLARRAGMIDRTCPGCGIPFEPPTRRRQTCSDACTHKLGQRRRREDQKVKANAK